MSVARVIPVSALPKLPGRKVSRVIMHWTAGGYTPNAIDRAHYHFLIDGQGEVVIGPRKPGLYLPHTRMLNTGSVGLAICAMRGARQVPFHAGEQPLTHLQWERACQAAAEILHAYGLELSERTLLCHSEVTRVYGRRQLGKWDVDRLAFDPVLKPGAVHANMRRKAEWYLKRLEKQQ